MKYQFFDDETMKKVNEILEVAEELVRQNTDIEGWKPTEGEWKEKLKQHYFPLRYYDKNFHNARIFFQDGFGGGKTRSKYPTLKLLKKSPAVGMLKLTSEFADASGYVSIPIEDDERKGEFASHYVILLDEDHLTKTRKEKGSEYFEAYVLYVLIHELRHMVNCIRIEMLEEKWNEEAKTHAETAEIFKQARLQKDVQEKILQSYADARTEKSG